MVGGGCDGAVVRLSCRDGRSLAPEWSASFERDHYHHPPSRRGCSASKTSTALQAAANPDRRGGEGVTGGFQTELPRAQGVARRRPWLVGDDDRGGLREPSAAGLSELPKRAREALAWILDFIRDCMDIVDAMPRSELPGYKDQLGEMAAPLREAGFCLGVETRSTRITKPGWTFGRSMSVVSLMAAPATEPPPMVPVARKIEFGRM